MIDLEDALVRRGWTATWAELREHFTRAQLLAARREGRMVRVAQGRYALPAVIGPARAAATRTSGVVSYLSAASYWGLPVHVAPPRPTVTVPRGRKLTAARRAGIRVAWANLPEGDVVGGVTTPLRTVLDVAARHAIEEALAVADAALRRELVSVEELQERAERMPKQVRDAVMRVVANADPRAESPFESAVRGLALDLPGLDLVPQVRVAGYRPDLYDPRLRLAVECDSFEHHSEREDLVRDAERYNLFALEGAMLIRFAWEHARPDARGYVRRTLAKATEVRQNQLSWGTTPLG